MQQTSHKRSATHDGGALRRDLEAALRICMEGEVRFDDGSRALYATDASNYRQVPVGVVVPRSVEDIVAAIEAARSHDVPILGRGCGTSLAGQCCNAAVVIDTSKYLNRVLEIDPERRLARVQPGTIVDDLRQAAAEHGLTFGPDPATHKYCTVGGMIGNNSCGVHSVLAEFYGAGPRTEDNIERLDVAAYDGVRLQLGRSSSAEIDAATRAGGRRGEIYARLKALGERYAEAIRQRFPNIPRRVSGYNLPELLPENGLNLAKALVGTESTCAITLEATVKLLPQPKARALLVLGYPDVFVAGDHVPQIRELKPIGLEGFDDVLIDYMKKKNLYPGHTEYLPEGGGWLLVEFGGTDRNEAAGRAREAMETLRRQPNAPRMRLYDKSEDAERIWEVRESGLGATAFVPGERNTWPGWEDSAVPPDRVGEYLRDLRKLLERHDYHCSLYGHLGQGCIHTRIDFDLASAAGIRKFRSFTNEAAELIVDRYRGSISGEHGEGQARGDLLHVMYGDQLMQAFREFKSIWDPAWKMNPGKVIDADPRDRHLRLGADYRPAQPQTHFQYPDDQGSLSHATLRCVGVGKCRRMDGGTMCPSFMVTREEKHTTRGRARLLFEMLQGEAIRDGWRSEAVKEALELCLACKGCKSDCPVNVDLATYKAEFLSHYYQGRLRPRSAYAFGLIHWWSRLASWLPEAANFFTQTRGLSSAAKFFAGVDPRRHIPEFAPRTFKERCRERVTPDDGRPAVILWADTFNNHFHPEVAEAALELLESAGYRVQVPSASLCCGRPLYDYGMLDTAKRLLRQILHALAPVLFTGTPVVVLEPSCAAVFRDELINLFPHDESAKRLKEQTYSLSEFLAERAPDFKPGRLERRALLQGHCHQRALSGLDKDTALLAKTGLDLTLPDSGCCGMAGSFGFEEGERFSVSMAAGERVLLPAVRRASEHSLIIADGFSCREQIRQATDREALHTAQVLQLARRGALPPGPERPEDAIVRRRRAEHAAARQNTAALVAGAAALAAASLWIAKKGAVYES